MVKLILLFIVGHVVQLLELAGVVALAVAAGMWFGAAGVLVVVGVGLLVKSFELDLGKPEDS